MQKAKLKYWLYLIVCLFFLTGVPAAQATSEEDLFNTQNDPDALIVLDLSGSMKDNPIGGSNRYGLDDCSGEVFSDTKADDYQTDCRRVDIAKRVIAKILDENDSSTITSADRTSMGVRFGYMRFYNCSSSSSESGITGYGSTAACTPDTDNCTGAACGREDGYCNSAIAAYTRYASNASCLADTTNCRGTGCSGGFCSTSTPSPTYYSATSSCTPDTFRCFGTGCSDGFCNASTSRMVYGSTAACTANDSYGNCTGNNCEGGFCTTSKNKRTYYAHSDCNKPNTDQCYARWWSDCSGGFCRNEHKPLWGRSCDVKCESLGCGTDCSANFTCAEPCTAAPCTTDCSSIGCEQSCVMTSALNWTTGCNRLISPISTLTGGVDVDTPYSCIYCRNSSTCSTTASTCGTDTACTNTGGNCVAGETADGGTHLAASLAEAKAYLDYHKNNDPNKYCRNKFAIVISDGADTYACNGDGRETQSRMYMRRRESVAMAKWLADNGYKVFVIGFGEGLGATGRNTLEWMAYYGQTDNPNVGNSGATLASNTYTIPETKNVLYPVGISRCDSSTSAHDPGDTGTYPLSGYAFFASDTKQLTAALKAALTIIRESTYSFTQASVQSSRTADENYIYEASFEPIQDDPFWRGHLKKFNITSDGKVGTLVTDGDAGDNLRTRTAASRNIWTAVNGSTYTSFTTSLAPDYFGLESTNTTGRDKIVNYIRGVCNASPGVCYNPDKDASGNVYKLGDIFRSTPVTIASPNPYFNDGRDYYKRDGSACKMTGSNYLKSATAFAEFRTEHCRASSCTTSYNGIADTQRRLIVVGANDGQLHAFKTADMSEAWSFIPPNHLAKLSMITHDTHPTTLGHQYFVDGPVTVADVWLGTGTLGNCKAKTEWKTLLVFGEGRGTPPYNWSRSPYCDGYFNSEAKFHATDSPHYCGYHALDVTDTLSPVYKWHIKGSGTGGAMTSAHGPYWGDAWGKMIPGRIRYKSGTNEVEKWVGFVGGGFNKSICTGTTCGTDCDCRGKGFFVIDLNDGTILWSFTNGGETETNTLSPHMKYSLTADPALVDTDGDSFVDTVYMGDLGGNMWRFEFCKNKDMPACVAGDWKGTRFFNGASMTTIRPIYTAAAVAIDTERNLWVIWGTGDKDDPIKIPTYKEYIFAVKDKLPANQPYTISSLSEVVDTAFTSTNLPANIGYYRNLPGSGEKMLAEPLAFGGYVYFTSYTPPSTASTDCSQDGAAKLYKMHYLTGLATSEDIGTGIPSAPVVSMRPGSDSIADMFITVSGVFIKEKEGDPDQNTGNPSVSIPTLSNRTNVLFWRDMRLQ